MTKQVKEKVEYYTPSVDELCDGVFFQEKEQTLQFVSFQRWLRQVVLQF